MDKTIIERAMDAVIELDEKLSAMQKVSVIIEPVTKGGVTEYRHESADFWVHDKLQRVRGFLILAKTELKKK